jgi:hypothetical protein
VATHKKPTKKRATTPLINHDKLRDRLRIIGDEYVFSILDDVIDAVPAPKLAKIVAQYIDLKQIAPDVESKRGKSTLAADVRAFNEKSRRGAYYEAFRVDSRNFMEKSPGTRAFIADCRRLLDRLVNASNRGDRHRDRAELRASFELMFELLRALNTGDDEMLFFADEGGAWQVGVPWDDLFPAWFTCLARTATPDEYARLVVDVVDEFKLYNRPQHLAVAKRLGNADQARALAALIKAPT